MPSHTDSNDSEKALVHPTPAMRRIPTQHPVWLRCAWARLHDRSTRTTGARDIVGQLVRTPSRPARLTLAGAEATGEPCDLHWQDLAELAHQAAALAAQRAPLSLPRVPAHSPTIMALKRAFAGKGLVVVRPTLGTPVIHLDPSWQDPLAHFNAGRRSDFRRAQRHAEKLGAISFDVHTSPDPAQLDTLLDEAYAVEAQSWKGARGTALRLDPLLGPFFRELAHQAAQEGILYLAFMRIAGQPVAMQLAVVFDQALWLLKIGYDAQFSRCSPGSLLMVHTLADAARSGWHRYEFLGSPAPWTEVWTQTLQAHVHVRVYPWSLPGLAALAQDTLQTARARMLKLRSERLPTMKKALLAPVRHAVFAVVEPLLRRASRAYVPGPKLDDAMRLARQVEAQGLSATIGYFDGDGDAADLIQRHDEAAIQAVTTLSRPSYVSIKVPSLQYDMARIRAIAQGAREHAQILHLDSHGPETAEPTLTVLGALHGEQFQLGLTIPGRWVRSPADAEWANARGIRVRVVKGQWACPVQPDMDPATGFLAVVDQLAGKAREVAVATHDAALAREAFLRLRRAGTPCELELLCGLPRAEVMAVAKEFDVPVRLYIPFGTAWLPYALGQLVRKPHMWIWMVRDLWSAMRHSPA